MGEIRLFGHPLDPYTGDISQVTFQVPPKHRCKLRAATPLKADEDEPDEGLPPAIGM